MANWRKDLRATLSTDPLLYMIYEHAGQVALSRTFYIGITATAESSQN